MMTDHGQRVYQARGSTAEWVNADARTHRVLDRIPVRSLQEVHTWALWIALAHNLMRTMAVVPHLMDLTRAAPPRAGSRSGRSSGSSRVLSS